MGSEIPLSPKCGSYATDVGDNRQSSNREERQLKAGAKGSLSNRTARTVPTEPPNSG
jgi:hypothetical protein